MKKILFAAVALVAMSFVACGEKTEAPVAEVDSVAMDTLAVDSIDSTAVDTVAAVVDSAAQAQ